MKHLLPFVVMFLSILGFAKPISIAVSVFPIANIVEQIAGTAGKVETVIPPFANPHHFTPRPSTAVKLQKTAVFFGVTPEFDGWIGKYLSEKTKVVFLKTSDQPNEHIWLYPEGGRQIARKAEKLLSGLYPEKSGVFQSNLQAFLKSVDETDKQIEKELAPLKGARFIQYHPAWNKFAARYGLKILATISNGHGKELSARELMDLIRKARAEHVQVVVMGLHKESRAVETLIREIHGRELRLDSLGNPEDSQRNTYQKLLMFNGKKLAGALHE